MIRGWYTSFRALPYCLVSETWCMYWHFLASVHRLFAFIPDSSRPKWSTWPVRLAVDHCIIRRATWQGWELWASLESQMKWDPILVNMQVLVNAVGHARGRYQRRGRRVDHEVKGEKLCCAAPTLFNGSCWVLWCASQAQVHKTDASGQKRPLVALSNQVGVGAVSRTRGPRCRTCFLPWLVVAGADRAAGHVFAMISSRRPGENPGRIRSYKKKLCVKKRNSQDKNRNIW